MPFDLDITESLTFRMGVARMLTRVLERHFGPLPDAVRQRIATASTEQMYQWDDREPSARSLGDIFADKTE
jgi:hypothetical protein